MPSLTKLDPFTRACALIGRFFFEWGYLESRINEAVGALLKLDQLQSAATCKNMTFKGKVDLLRASIELFTLKPPEWKAEQSKRLSQLLDYAGKTRNKLAHDAFIPSRESDGVRFVAVQANSRIEFPKVDWSSDRFEAEYSQIKEYAELIKTLQEEIVWYHAASRALKPKPSTLAQVLTGLQFPPPQGHPDDDHATQETDSQTPEEPRE